MAWRRWHAVPLIALAAVLVVNLVTTSNSTVPVRAAAAAATGRQQHRRLGESHDADGDGSATAKEFHAAHEDGKHIDEETKIAALKKNLIHAKKEVNKTEEGVQKKVAEIQHELEQLGPLDRRAAKAWRKEYEAEAELLVARRSLHLSSGVAVLLCCCLCACCAGACGAYACAVDHASWGRPASKKIPFFYEFFTMCEDGLSGLCLGVLGLHVLTTDGKPDVPKIGRIVTREARGMLLLPLIPLFFYPWTTCEDGLPAKAYLAYLPLLIRSRIVELRITCELRQLQREPTQGFPTTLALGALMGSLEHADWFTDGAFPMQAYACDATFTPRWAEMFSQSSFSAFASVVMYLHFWGAAVIVFFIGALAQQVVSVPGFAAFAGQHVSAGTAGYSVAGDMLEDHDPRLAEGLHLGEPRLAPFTAVFSKALLENVPQLWLQTSFFGLAFGGTSTAGKYKQLVSIGLGLVCASAKIIGRLWALEGEFIGVTIPMHLALVAALCVVLVLAFKVYMTFECESHLWNVTSGCVDMDSLMQ